MGLRVLKKSCALMVRRKRMGRGEMRKPQEAYCLIKWRRRKSAFALTPPRIGVAEA